MPTTQTLLMSVALGLERFQQRIKSKDLREAAVIYRPDGARSVGRNEIAIGTGSFEVSDDGHPAVGICLNDKQGTNALKLGRQLSSVTDLVLNAPKGLLDQWLAIIGSDSSPEAFFSRFTLVVEDVSPDSCFGLLCLLMRVGGIAPDLISKEWVDYIEAWERGDIVIGANIYSAYGCLHNALVHGKFNDDFAEAWIDGMCLMREALLSDEGPAALSTSTTSAIFQRARALLRFEEQKYEESLDHATCIQLALPIANTSNRFRLIDAYFAESTLALGSLKVFARTDRIRPFLKNGFTLMAIYRAVRTGEGDDMTISVDPSANVELRELWSTLELAEDKKWDKDRPNDTPRLDILGYKNGKRHDGTNAPNQPWYDGRDYTLIASPRRLDDDRLGSKLEWSDVLESLWQTYQPFRSVKVLLGAGEITYNTVPPSGKLMPLVECYPEVLSDDIERQISSHGIPLLFVAGWYRPDSSEPSFHITPTFCKYLAACIRRWQPAGSTTQITLRELPDETEYDVLSLPGMVAVVSRFGAFLVYDVQRFRPPLHEMKYEFERAVKIRQRIERGASHLAAFLDDIKAYLAGKRSDLLEVDLLQRLATEQIEITLELHRAHAAVISNEARRFRETVLDRWGIHSWLDSLANDITHIKNILYGRIDLDNARRLAALHKYGALVILATAVYGFSAASENLWQWPPLLSSIQWYGLVIFSVFIFSTLLLEAIDLDSGPRVAFLRRYGVPLALAAAGCGVIVASENLRHWPPLLHDLRWHAVLILSVLISSIILITTITQWRRRKKLKSAATLSLDIERRAPLSSD